VSVSKQLKQSLLDADAFKRGLADGDGGKALLTDQEIEQVFRAYQAKLMTKLLDKNKKEGEAFLAANKSKPGVKSLPSGLQYKVLKEGDGPSPKTTDAVKANYRGTLIDGTEFDSSYKKGVPIEFPVSRVIKGWTEALQLMKVGSKWQLFIPAELAYGAQARPTIPPNSTLVFEVELVAIEPAQ
jgi:FKBP-type peptidyl-prolyl cis-trans isomerase